MGLNATYISSLLPAALLLAHKLLAFQLKQLKLKFLSREIQNVVYHFLTLKINGNIKKYNFLNNKCLKSLSI